MLPHPYCSISASQFFGVGSLVAEAFDYGFDCFAILGCDYGAFQNGCSVATAEFKSCEGIGVVDVEKTCGAGSFVVCLRVNNQISNFILSMNLYSPRMWTPPFGTIDGT